MDGNGCDREEEPPPLEDMTEELEKICKINRTVLPRIKPVPNELDAPKRVEPQRTRAKKSDTKEDTGFCGLQKGFLSSSKTSKPPSSSKKKKSAESLTDKTSKTGDYVIRPKKSSGLEFPEVQEAMKEINPILAADKWLTQDLLSKVEGDPILAKGFSDPNMMQYLNLLQTNPKQAFAAAQGNPELQKFMQSFCSLMGSHFGGLDEAVSQGSSSEPAIMAEDEVKVKKLLSKPEVKRTLEDSRIQKLLQLLKTDPTAAQRLLSETKSEDFNTKIGILLQNDLLSLH